MGDGERFWQMFISVGCVVGLWSTTHTSGDVSAPSVLNTQQRFVYMQRCRGSIPATPLKITNHCYTAKIILCSLVGDHHTPVSQHHALAWVGH